MPRKRQRRGGYVLGVISDTHGTLTPEAARALSKVDLIIHAGDIDNHNVLKALQNIAPVIAVRGNMDRGGWTKDLSRTEVVEVGDMAIYVLHDVHALDLDPASAGFKAVISGHTHRPSIEKKGGVLYLNPGSAWWPRANYPATIAIVTVEGDGLAARLVDVEPSA
jgi:putative phosphoesterase